MNLSFARRAAVALCLLLIAPIAHASGATYTTDKGGFIPYWIGLGPIQVGKDAIRGKALNFDYLDGKHTPRIGDAYKDGDTQLTWSAIESKHNTPVVECFDKIPNGDNTIYYMVSYVVSDKEIPHVMIGWGSDDGGVVYVNDQEVGRYDGPRMCTPDSDSTTDFTLKKGVNVIMIRVQNIGFGCYGVARLVGEDENGLAGLKISSTPDDTDAADAKPWTEVDTGSKPLTGPAPLNLVAGQIGYNTVEEKLAVATSGRPKVWHSIQICDTATSQPVFEIPKDGGEIQPSVRQADVSQSVARVYFGAFQKPGRYYLYSPEYKVRSLDFNIADNVFADVAKEVTRMFYFQRQGQAHDEKTAGVWAGPAYHDPSTADHAQVHKHPGGNWLSVGGPVIDETKRNVNGGWYDAGDPNKYTHNEMLAINVMLMAYDLNKPYCKDGDLNIPESGNGVPDLVDEARYGADYLMRIQREDGAVFDRVAHGDNPKGECQIAEPCSGATLCAISSLAWTGAVWQEGGWDKDYAKKCIDAAEKSWNYIKDHPDKWPAYPIGSIDGGYGDETSLRNIAAAALYRATGKDEYKQITEDAFVHQHGDKSLGRWCDMIQICNNYMLTKGANPEIYNAYGRQIAGDAEKFRKAVGKNSKQYSYGAGWAVYCWSSNSGVAQECFGMAWWATHWAPEREKPLFAQAASEYMQYLTGRNPTGWGYITNLQHIGGEHSAQILFSFLNRVGDKWLTPSAEHPDRVGCYPGYLLGGPMPTITSFGFDQNKASNDYVHMEPSIVYQCHMVAMAQYLAGIAREHRAIPVTPEIDPATLTPVAIAPNDPLIRYVGRFDTRDAAGPRCAWSGSDVILKFTGTAIAARIKASAREDYLQVVLDGQPGSPLQIGSDGSFYPIASGLKDGEHTLELFKRTEAAVDTIQYLGFNLQTGKTLVALPDRPKHRIEIVGDSQSCGYGDEATDKSQHSTPSNENNYLAYGAIAARALDAEYVCIAWSGRTMAPNNTMPSIYDYALPNDQDSKWDFTQWQPDVVVINLGTNDFKGKNPDEKMWTEAYAAFIKKLRGVYPKAHIVCAEGCMMSDADPHWHGAQTAVRQYLADMIDQLKTEGIDNVDYVEFKPQTDADGYGADWHPSLKSHQDMADKLVSELKRIMNW